MTFNLSKMLMTVAATTSVLGAVLMAVEPDAGSPIKLAEAKTQIENHVNIELNQMVDQMSIEVVRF